MATAATSERRERHACDVANDDTWPLQHYSRIYDRYTERPMLPCMLRCYHATTMLLGGEGVQRCRRLRGRKLVEGRGADALLPLRLLIKRAAPAARVVG